MGLLKEILKSIVANLAANSIGRYLENLFSMVALLAAPLWSLFAVQKIMKNHIIPRVYWDPPPEEFVLDSVNVDGDDFDIYILSQEYSWLRGTSTHIQIGSDSRTFLDIERTMKRFSEHERVKRMKDIVFVGLALCEGDPENEVERAEARARQLVDWFGLSAVKGQRAYTLSLGQYDTKRCSSFTSKSELRRPIVILGVNRMSPRLEKTAVRTAMEISESLNIDVRRYSDFRIKPAR